MTPHGDDLILDLIGCITPTFLTVQQHKTHSLIREVMFHVSAFLSNIGATYFWMLVFQFEILLLLQYIRPMLSNINVINVP